MNSINSRLYRPVELHLDSPPLFQHAVLLRDMDKFTFTFGVCHRVTRERKWIVGRRSWPLEHHVYFRSLRTCKCWNNNRNKTVSGLRKWRSEISKKGHWTTASPYAALPWNRPMRHEWSRIDRRNATLLHRVRDIEKNITVFVVWLRLVGILTKVHQLS